MHFFNNDLTYEQGFDALMAKLPSAAAARKKAKDKEADSAAMYIDGTPMLECDLCWTRMRDTYGTAGMAKLRLIAILREPVSRDVSAYAHALREQLYLGAGFEYTKTLQELRVKDDIFMYGGQYAPQLRHVVEVFRRDQVLVLSTAMLVANTTYVVKRILRFLGLPPALDSTVLRNPLPHNDHVEQLRERSGSPALVDCVVRHVPALDCAERDYMAKYYEPRNADLYKWIRSTRAEAHPMEPAFPPFDDPAKTVACVDDARAVYDAVVQKDAAGHARGLGKKDFPESGEKEHLADRDVNTDGCRAVVA